MHAAKLTRIAVALAAAASLAACATAPEPAPLAKKGGTWRPYQVNGVWYTPREQPKYDEVGVASWYGGHHQGRPTANGERFDKDAVSAAHKTLPLPSVVEVINLDNGKKIRVRLNDRGPFVAGRIIDLSQEAARRLGFERAGIARVRVRYVGPGGARSAELDMKVFIDF
ncbi:septal ring lytic transglycosylase RlpA family protein [Phenylobacterium sp.]|uniref:septal ring lytic transglycosylase RlpA family protein n=1 Tax=Phenylobacterium sp. TaxID=1871053 RepID=UPI0039830660